MRTGTSLQRRKVFLVCGLMQINWLIDWLIDISKDIKIDTVCMFLLTKYQYYIYIFSPFPPLHFGAEFSVLAFSVVPRVLGPSRWWNATPIGWSCNRTLPHYYTVSTACRCDTITCTVHVVRESDSSTESCSALHTAWPPFPVGIFVCVYVWHCAGFGSNYMVGIFLWVGRIG